MYIVYSCYVYACSLSHSRQSDRLAPKGSFTLVERARKVESLMDQVPLPESGSASPSTATELDANLVSVEKTNRSTSNADTVAAVSDMASNIPGHDGAIKEPLSPQSLSSTSQTVPVVATASSNKSSDELWAIVQQLKSDGKRSQVGLGFGAGQPLRFRTYLTAHKRGRPTSEL